MLTHFNILNNIKTFGKSILHLLQMNREMIKLPKKLR